MVTKTKTLGNNQSPTDIFLKKNKYIPINAIVEQHKDRISDAALGALVRKNHALYNQVVADNIELWKEEGESFREARCALNISRNDIAKNIGVCPATIGKYEKGQPVRSRNILRRSGITAMELIQFQRNSKLEDIKF